MPRVHRTLLTAAVSAILALGAAAPSSAAILDRWDIAFSDSGEAKDFCGVRGLNPTFTFDVTGTAMIVQRGPRGFDYYLDTTRFVGTYTYRGMTITEYGAGTDKDLSIVDNGDGTLSVTVLLTGGARVMGHEGKPIAKNDGQIRLLLTVDSTTWNVIDEVLVFGSTGTNDDFCEAVLADWGVTP
ncbi:hypothetical protein [Sinomonas halotolerans]|uniref:Uncharacterized protein n=1 Tax=Sinomonas halotolerans TaxID=1644133 RepID=A0ABU9WVT8_9MICC